MQTSIGCVHNKKEPPSFFSYALLTKLTLERSEISVKVGELYKSDHGDSESSQNIDRDSES